MLTILFDGIAYGMLLFIIAVGLSITLGLMNFINLAHGAFAMAGGYITVVLMNRYGVSFYLCLPIAFLVVAAAGGVLERTLYRRLYAAPHLDQVLFSIGLVFMSVAAVQYFMGGQQQLIHLPPELSGRTEIFGVGVGRYRLFITAVCAILVIALQLALSKTRFGSQLRAAVDDGRVARGLGINVSAVFALTFAVGSGLAGLGGAMGAEVLGLDPNFPLKFMVYFLIVVTVGGTSSITGPFAAALLLGIADVAGKYYVPEIGAFVIYAVMVIMLVLRPHGLFAREGSR
ncbi:branched-chain amino acid ABC transporter permease [Chelativorans sp. AA-79]|uniref:branched-chain amino acid ABC transporter permease n=1 Tax=Chelativorans sp. AA-79 TaxID=3028735 RepID=UPI0023F83983|nr:branched-chain amino acid ABC transporter permease [Chelativorans sp. AA-79]WEX10401.1 branched-chain amino acid ABC transporter permease [Chelativorans sp. AA-79]